MLFDLNHITTPKYYIMTLIFWMMNQGWQSLGELFSFFFISNTTLFFFLFCKEIAFNLRKFCICFSLMLDRRGGVSLWKIVLGGYTYISIHIPSFTGGKRISWLSPLLFFSCLTIHMCSLSMEFSDTVSQLNFMYVSAVFTVFPCWDGKTLLPLFSLQ